MTPEESEIIEFYIEHLDRAIQKSKIKKDFWAFRGVSELSWLKYLAVGEVFTEDAFGSFSADLETAYKYTNPNNPIIFRLKINDKMEALYIDETENEILRPRNRKYKIIEIFKEKTDETVSINKETNTKSSKEITFITIEEISE
ncbi:ADP-ribosyltransferase [Methanimicrococcus blatticola]|uniref:ADP-ribosyltransferase n=1 Tax=Methanimicrococcus blatticola TaxID=91560 RepID=UPI001415105D|nr:ADP-ribosyltransferase [Methanimicrococcus blatticola]MBZ3936065.1 hypothetical protein [Methanimicrococcus blatticola]